jgi:hypothetical protein
MIRRTWTYLNLLFLLLAFAVEYYSFHDFWQQPSTQVLDVQGVGWWRLALADTPWPMSPRIVAISLKGH